MIQELWGFSPACMSARFVRSACRAGLLVMLMGGLLHGQTAGDAPSPGVEESSPAAREESTDAKTTGHVVDQPRFITDEWKRFSELALWEDGLSEMSYYDATCVIYDTKRSYTRVHLMNRQFMDERRWIKASDSTVYRVPAFKFVVSEEVPTENYNYRILMTTFLERPNLEPLKVSVSSQEWCGHTFKILQWSRFQELEPKDWSLDLCSYSYFPDEGDVWWPLPSNTDAYESLPLFARAVVASGGQSRAMHLLRSQRSNRAPDPKPIDAVLKMEGGPRSIRVPLGKFEAQRVVVDWEGEPTWYDVETTAPFRVLEFREGDVNARLRLVERRAYWDRNCKSCFHEPNQAP